MPARVINAVALPRNDSLYQRLVLLASTSRFCLATFIFKEYKTCIRGDIGYTTVLPIHFSQCSPSVMNSPKCEAWFRTCVCGRVFSTPQAISYHQRSCQKTRKRLSVALAKAGEAWRAKKRQKTDGTQAVVSSPNGNLTAGLQSTAPRTVEGSQDADCSSNENVIAKRQWNIDHPRVRLHILFALLFINGSSGR